MQSSEQLKRYAPIALVVGFVGLLAAAVIWLIVREVTPYVQGALAVGLLGLALAGLFNPGAIQKWLLGRQARYGGNALIMTTAMVGILGIVNYLAYKNPVSWDLTADKTNTLAPETLAALEQLPEPVNAIGFYTSDNASRSTTQNLLVSYRAASQGKFTFELVDPRAEPGLVQQYNVTRNGTLVLEMGELREELSFATEAEITGALIRFAHPAKRAIYFLTGHGEHDIAGTASAGLSQMVELLKKQNYDVFPLNLQVTDTVPADARAVVIAGPLVPVTAEEVQKLSDYLQFNQDTALVVMLDTPLQMQVELDQPLSDPLVDYLSQTWGIAPRADIIADTRGGDPQTLFLTVNDGYESSPITSKLLNISTVFAGSRSISVTGTAETFPGLTYTPMIKTFGSAWGETNFQGLLDGESPTQDETDAAGPLWLAVTVQHTAQKTRLVVFGDSDFAANDASQVGANSLLFLNSINWATAEESLINLTPKIPTTRSLTLTDPLTLNLIFFFVVIVLPLGVLVLGGVVWFLRRRHV
jgi:ABC-type uncharacterized transport system involved in gliding motility auxiliary subunit